MKVVRARATRPYTKAERRARVIWKAGKLWDPTNDDPAVAEFAKQVTLTFFGFVPTFHCNTRLGHGYLGYDDVYHLQIAGIKPTTSDMTPPARPMGLQESFYSVTEDSTPACMPIVATVDKKTLRPENSIYELAKKREEESSEENVFAR